MAFIPTGVNKQIIFAKEATYGISPATGATAKYKRRTSLDLNLTRDTFESALIETHAQTSDMRSGMDTIEGTLASELMCTAFEDEFAAILRGPWAAVANITAATISLNASTKKITRSSGSWLTDGIKFGFVIRASGFATAANNIDYVVTSVTATDITYTTVDVNAVPVTEAAGASVTIKVPGKILAIPLLPSSRTTDSFTIEQFYDTVNISERYVGCMLGTASVDIAPNAISTVEFSIQGSKKVTPDGSVQYFTSPVAAPTTSSMAGNAGCIVLDGERIAIATAASLSIGSDLTPAEVIGARNSPAIFRDRIRTTGEVSLYFTDNEIQQKFVDETEVGIVFTFTGNGSEVMNFIMPRCKLGGAEKTDEENTGVVQTVPFTALLPTTATGVNQSTIIIQDTTLA